MFTGNHAKLDLQTFAKNVDTKRLLVIGYDHLTDVEEKAGNFKQSLAYHRQYELYKDSMHTDDLNKVIGKESVTQNVEGEDLLLLTTSDRVVVSVTIPASGPNLEGNLKLQSKATYFFEIKEQEE